MKFVYGYKTKDNVTREGIIFAHSRDAVYATLKKKGIRPFKVDLAPGVINKIASFGKHWLAIVALTLIVFFLLWRLLTEEEAVAPLAWTLDSTTRRQPIGDAAIIEKGIRSGWDFVFADEAERYLASFAVPGVSFGVKSVAERQILEALSRRISVVDGDGIEARQIKAMVEGIKDEMRAFLSAGGSVRQYGHLLAERQEREMGYYYSAQQEIDRLVASGAEEELIAQLWEKRNSELRQMGIKLIPFPDRFNEGKRR